MGMNEAKQPKWARYRDAMIDANKKFESAQSSLSEQRNTIGDLKTHVYRLERLVSILSLRLEEKNKWPPTV